MTMPSATTSRLVGGKTFCEKDQRNNPISIGDRACFMRQVDEDGNLPIEAVVNGLACAHVSIDSLVEQVQSGAVPDSSVPLKDRLQERNRTGRLGLAALRCRIFGGEARPLRAERLNTLIAEGAEL